VALDDAEAGTDGVFEMARSVKAMLVSARRNSGQVLSVALSSAAQAGCRQSANHPCSAMNFFNSAYTRVLGMR
jgi:hypothetical protein